MLGSLVRAADYIQAQRRRTELLEEIENAFRDYDIIITTAMLTPQPPLDDKAPFPFLDVPMIAVPFNLTLHPVQTVRAGFFDDGMPIGAQVIGRHFLLKGTAKSFEVISVIFLPNKDDDLAIRA